MGTPKAEFLDKLAQLRASTCDQLPTPQLAVLTRLTARLRRSGILGRCLQPGETAPDFDFIDGHNNSSSLYALLDEGPVVINFFRGLWCPYCRTELEAFESVRDQLGQLGCQYLAITPQKRPQETPSDDVPDGSYELIYDRNNTIAQEFDLVYRLAEEEIALFAGWGIPIDDADDWTLPLPATYLVATDRTVAYQFVDVDFRSRCCPDDLMAEVRALTG